MGIYVFSTDELVRRVSQDARQESAHDFGKNVIPAMVNDGARVFAYPFKDENKKDVAYWRDVGTLDAYFEANMDLTKVNPLFNLYDESWPVRTYREPAPPAKFVFSEPGAIGSARRGEALESLISPGVIVSGGTVERSVLASNVRVNSYCHVEDCILMEGVNVGRRARVRKAIVDKGVRIPEGAVIGYDPNEDRKRFAVSAGGVVIVPKEIFL
jgi:glucose-1-phosphate adenylyltransferase